MNGLDNIVNDSEQQKAVTCDDSSRNYTYTPKTPQAIDGNALPKSFVMKDIGEGFTPRAKGFIGKRPRNAF